MRSRLPILLSLGLVALGWAGPARAGLVLSFDMPTYTERLGQTAGVQLLLTQTPAGTQVTPTNALLGAAIQLTYNPGVVSLTTITGGPAWDLSSSSPGTGTATLALSSILGIGTIPNSGLLLGTFTFRGSAVGITPITARSLTPGSSFPTSGGNFLDPTNTASAVVTVLPEPASATLTVIGGMAAAGGWALRRRRRRASA
jgi:hypothetical protein